jgi:integrase
MAKRVRDSILESRAAREKLPPRGKPHYKTIAQGLHLGYRKNKTGGMWVARLYLGNQNYVVETIATADDKLAADGKSVLDFWQAQQKASELHTKLNATAPDEPVPALTVRQAVEAYIAVRDARDSRRKGRTVRSDASRRLRRYVLGQEARGKHKAVPPAAMADIAMSALTEDDLASWRANLPDSLKVTTIQRLVNDLKAALHSRRKQLDSALVLRDGLKADTDDDADGDDVARENQILSDAQVMRLNDAAREVDAAQERDGDLFRLVLVLAATGARFSQIARMRVGDCQLRPVLDSHGKEIAPGRLMVPVSRKGNGGKKSDSISVPVGPDVLDALRPVVTGRPNDAPLLERWRLKQMVGGIRWVRDGRGPWQSSSELTRPWQAIREHAEMPDVIPYALRHSSIVRGIRENLPIRLVAAKHDTSVAMIERHYGRWVVDGLEELAARAIVPLMSPVGGGGKVVAMKSGRA